MFLGDFWGSWTSLADCRGIFKEFSSGGGGRLRIVICCNIIQETRGSATSALWAGHVHGGS
jgi:hypothetical protein